jgi:hypothetical protein
MGNTATATLHTPWDCRWSRFARRTSDDQTRGSLWECAHTGSRVPIAEADCASCPHWEYQSPMEGVLDRATAYERAAAHERAKATIDGGIRVSLLVLAVIFAACGFVVLTQPLAVPFTVTMWMGAAMSFMAAVFGNFRSQADGTFRGLLPPRT